MQRARNIISQCAAAHIKMSCNDSYPMACHPFGQTRSVINEHILRDICTLTFGDQTLEAIQQFDSFSRFSFFSIFFSIFFYDRTITAHPSNRISNQFKIDNFFKNAYLLESSPHFRRDSSSRVMNENRHRVIYKEGVWRILEKNFH